LKVVAHEAYEPVDDSEDLLNYRLKKRIAVLSSIKTELIRGFEYK